VEDSTLSALMAHAWPGNVRELRNVADRFVLGLLGDDFSGSLGQHERSASLPEHLEHIERALITESLRRLHGDVTSTAQALGVPKQTLYDKLRRLGIDATEFRAAPV
jgi:two-component system, NtrC family, C4-dicarboxylate transport response regulator DctD